MAFRKSAARVTTGACRVNSMCRQQKCAGACRRSLSCPAHVTDCDLRSTSVHTVSRSKRELVEMQFPHTTATSMPRVGCILGVGLNTIGTTISKLRSRTSSQPIKRCPRTLRYRWSRRASSQIGCRPLRSQHLVAQAFGRSAFCDRKTNFQLKFPLPEPLDERHAVAKWVVNLVARHSPCELV